MYNFDVILKNVYTDNIQERLEEAGSGTIGNQFEVHVNRAKGHALICFFKDVPEAHEGYFDIIHELTDASLINNVHTIERT